MSPPRLVGTDASSTAGWSQDKSGEWHLEADAPIVEDAIHVWFLHDDGGRHGVIKVQLGADLWR